MAGKLDISVDHDLSGWVGHDVPGQFEGILTHLTQGTGLLGQRIWGMISKLAIILRNGLPR